MSAWMQTYMGTPFEIAVPSPSRIHALDIGHHLALICRFNGACNAFYSVAQHSVLVSENVPGHLALEGLLHDAHEAYIGDITRPMKLLLDSSVLAHVTRELDKVIGKKFGCQLHPLRTEVKHADNVLLATERRDLMVHCERPWAPLPDPLHEPIRPWPWEEAKERFLERLKELERKR